MTREEVSKGLSVVIALLICGSVVAGLYLLITVPHMEKLKRDRGNLATMIATFVESQSENVYAVQNCKGGGWGGTCWISTDPMKPMMMVRCQKNGRCWVVQNQPG